MCPMGAALLYTVLKEKYPFTGLLPCEANLQRVNTILSPVSLYTSYTNASHVENLRHQYLQNWASGGLSENVWLKFNYTCTCSCSGLYIDSVTSLK